jgi:hypothetical protein
MLTKGGRTRIGIGKAERAAVYLGSAFPVTEAARWSASPTWENSFRVNQ